MSILTNTAAAGIEAARLYDEQRRAETRYREALHMAADGIISIDETQRIVVFNRGAEKLFGYSAGEAIGQPLDMLLPTDVAAVHRLHVRGFGLGPDESRAMAERDRLAARRKDGTLVDIEVSISRHSETDRTIYTAVVRDITQRIRQTDRIARLTRLYEVLSDINAATSAAATRPILTDICRITADKGRFIQTFVGTGPGYQ